MSLALTPAELAQYLDHTLLKPEATSKEIEKLCAEAREHKFRSVCVNGSRVELAASLLEESGVLVAPVVEFHTGKYVELVFAGDKSGAAEELTRLQDAAAYGHARGIEIHVGHGLTYDTVRPVASIPEVRELNIGHFIMGEALFVGLDAAVKRMRQEIDAARSAGPGLA